MASRSPFVWSSSEIFAPSSTLESPRHGIRVNAIAPGPIDTSMAHRPAYATARKPRQITTPSIFTNTPQRRPAPLDAGPLGFAGVKRMLLVDERADVAGIDAVLLRLVAGMCRKEDLR